MKTLRGCWSPRTKGPIEALREECFDCVVAASVLLFCFLLDLL